MAEYVNNAKLVHELIEYKKRLASNPKERVPEYIGKCILDICTRSSLRHNFIGYSYRDEMVADAVENCLRYITNFDPEKSNNAFAYITQIAFYAFIRRIAKEKTQSYIKHKIVQDLSFDSFELQDSDDQELSQQFISYIQSHNSFDFENFEKKLPKKKLPKAATVLDNLMEE